MNIYLDIETIPTDRQDVRDYIAATVTHPATMSKPETIAKWEQEAKPAAIEEAVSKTALDGTFGRVCVIGWRIEGRSAMVSLSENDEAGVLRDFSEAMSAIPTNEQFNCAIVGHNVSWDVRFLHQRYVLHGIKPPLVLSRAAQAKPWESDKLYDTMIQWAGVGNRISLDKLCKALGLPGKGEIDGSRVWDYVRDGRIAEVADYCADDVRKVWAVYQRMTFAKVTQPELEDVPA